MRSSVLSLVLVALIGGCDDSKGDKPAPAPVKTEQAETKDSKPKEARVEAKVEAKAEAKAEDSKSAPESPEPEAPKAEAPKAAEAEPPEPTEPFADGLAKLAAEDLDAAVELFERHHPDEAEIDATQERVDLVALIERIESRFADVQGEVNAAREAAACRQTGKCDSGEPTPEAKAWLEQTRETGIVFVYAGEGMVEPAVDFSGLHERMKGSLSEAGSAWLAAQALEQQVTSNLDEGGYEGDPKLVVDALLACEAVDAHRKTYADWGDVHGLRMLDIYLTMARAPFVPGKVEIPAKHRESWEDFVADHPESKFAPAVQAFLDKAKRAKFKMTGDEMAKLAQAAADEIR